MLLKWYDEVAIGVERIDNRNKELLMKINLLLESMLRQRGQDEIMDTLNFLETYIAQHFDDEEAIQKKHNYPGYEIQHAQHEEFKQNLLLLKKSIEVEKIKASSIIIIQQNICNWWVNHIGKSDKNLGKYLSEIDC